MSKPSARQYGTVDAPDPDDKGWHYGRDPSGDGDGRKLVTLELDGMEWVGIRYWQSAFGRWLNNGEPTTECVIAWQDLPEPAEHRFVNGLLT